MSSDRLLLLDAGDVGRLIERLEGLRGGSAVSEGLAELDAGQPADGGLRAAVVAADAEELVARVDVLIGWLGEGAPELLRAGRGIALARPSQRPSIGFLFPGQGAPVTSDAGYLEDLLPAAAAPYREAGDLSAGDVPDELVQLSVVAASVAGLKAMRELGIDANFGIGHSVGELTALHWAGAIDEAGVLELARRRGEIMTEHATEQGAMATVEAEESDFTRIVEDADVTVACLNSPLNRVVSGPKAAVDSVVERAREQDGARALKLGVVGAFHSPLMDDAAPVFERVLAEQRFDDLLRPVFSTISGNRIAEGDDVAELLRRQVTEPVLFLNAVRAAVGDAELLIEVGPGRMLSALVSQFSSVPALPTRVGSSSAQELLTAVGAAWALGADVKVDRISGV